MVLYFPISLVTTNASTNNNLVTDRVFLRKTFLRGKIEIAEFPKGLYFAVVFWLEKIFIVMKIFFGFSWNFSVSLHWKRKKYNVPIPFSPYGDTSAYPLHTWNVLLNLTVYFKGIEEKCSKQSFYFFKKIKSQNFQKFFRVFTKELCGIQIPSKDCGHDDKNNESGC